MDKFIDPITPDTQEAVHAMKTAASTKLRENHFVSWIAPMFRPFERRYLRDKLKDSAPFASNAYTGETGA